MTQLDNTIDADDGVVYISQSQLIGLQRDAHVISQKKGKIRSRFNGSFLSAFKGRGMEFDEARPYQPGDDVRNMDWRVTARTNKPYSKVFREERERPVLLWVDFRAPMFFGTQQYFKSVLAAKVAALLAWKSSRQGDRLGSLFFSESHHLEMRPATGKSSALQLMKKLSEFSVQSRVGSPLADMHKNNSKHALNRLLHVTRPGSLIYLISDFRNMSSQFESTLSRLGRHNELEMIQISDPLETHLPDEGYYRVTDGQNETQVNAFNRQSRTAYQQRFSQHQQNLKDLCKKNRIRFQAISTDQNLLEGLLQG